MIVLINGAFGVGKTTVAHLLQQRLANSMIYDPEEIGTLLRKMLDDPGIERLDDYQHYELWPVLTVEIGRRLYRQYRRTLIVPMTLAFPAYFHAVKGGFAQFEPNLHHFCLTASLETIHRRLEQRGAPPGDWAYQQTMRCLSAFASPDYEIFVDTEQRTPTEIVESIVAQVG